MCAPNHNILTEGPRAAKLVRANLDLSKADMIALARQSYPIWFKDADEEIPVGAGFEHPTLEQWSQAMDDEIARMWDNAHRRQVVA